MKKMFKAVATLAVGCALLSTSAFAADTISGTVEKDATGAAVTINGYETSAQSTILVVKDTAVLEAIPSNLADSAIAYINQSAVAEKKAVYDVNVTGDGVYTVFAGGSDVAAATKIGSFEIKSVVDVTGVAITGANAGDKITVGKTLQLAATVTPDNATDKTVTWSASNGNATVDANGLVTAVAAGDVVITAKAGNIEATIALVVEAEVVEEPRMIGDLNNNKFVDANDLAQLIAYLNDEESSIVDEEWNDIPEMVETADINGNGFVDANDLAQYIAYMNDEESLFDELL
jgi:alpha-amylase